MTAAAAPSCVDLQTEWDKCVNKALGFEDWDEVVRLDAVDNDSAKSKNDSKRPDKPIILNLLEDPDDDESDESNDGTGPDGIRNGIQPTLEDPWMDSALRIYRGAVEIQALLHRKTVSYLDPSVDSHEASLLESTILSYVATTANQIDSLRKSLSPDHSRDYLQHCQGVVSLLMLVLKEEIANPFKRLQKQRTRTAVSLWQQPLQCSLAPVQASNAAHVDGGNDDGEIRFLPNGPAPTSLDAQENGPTQQSFMDTYQTTSFTAKDLQRPTSIFAKKSEPPPLPATKTGSTMSLFSPLKNKKQGNRNNDSDRLPYEQGSHHGGSGGGGGSDGLFGMSSEEDEQQQQQMRNDALAQEAVLLTAKAENDLDTVQQVEARMTEITTLLSQFSELVTEQQEGVSNIHETTVRSKENVSKGQDHLVDAAERVKKSKHYMATCVTAMALLLLFFNYVSP